MCKGHGNVKAYHDMANCPVEGSDKFLHLSCVMVDMMSMVYGMRLRFTVVDNRCRDLAGKTSGRNQRKEKVSKNKDYKLVFRL